MRDARQAPLYRYALGLCLVVAGQIAASSAASAQDNMLARALASSDKRQLTEWGRRYQNGEGVQRNLESAIRLYCKAAKAGDVDAQYYLGYIYATGSGVRRDEELAAAWLHMAAAQNDPQSRRILTRLGYAKKPRRAADCALPAGGDARRPRALLALGPTIPSLAKGPIADMARTLAAEYKLDPNLVLAVIETESNFNPSALSPKSAQGLMQLIPATAERFGVRNVWDPEQNMRGGMAYLRWLLGEFGGDVRLALAGYNAGEGAVHEHGGIPPFPETQDYVTRIMRKISP
jgi:soluble lytic murein transglycosylase-like protein